MLDKFSNESIGYMIGGGLKEGFRVRLTVSADTVQEGSFVVCDSGPWRFFGLVTDLQLGATDPRFADELSEPPRMNAHHSQRAAGQNAVHDVGNVPHADDGPRP